MNSTDSNTEHGAPPPTHEKSHPDHPETGPIVTIFVDDKPLQIHRGNQTIASIKQASGVALADQLQLENADGSLQKLDQGGSITLNGGEKFQSFSATGKSS
jgi:hypothetical protein